MRLYLLFFMKEEVRTNEAVGLERAQEWSSDAVRPDVFIKLISKPASSYSTSRDHKNRDYINFLSDWVKSLHIKD